MIGRIPRWIRWILILLLIAITLYVIAYSVLTSAAFSRFVLGRVESALPGLDFDQVEGSFTRGLRFNLRYAAEGTSVQVDRAALRIRPECLWQMRVCIDYLQAGSLEVALPAGEAVPEQPAARPDLPTVSLPVPVFLNSLTVGSLEIKQERAVLYQLSGLESALSWRESTLSIRRLIATDPYCHWAIRGEVRFRNRYPLTTNIHCGSVAGHGKVAAVLTGDLEQLRAQLDARLVSPYTAQPAPVTASATLAPLRDNLPFHLEAQTGDPVRLLIGGEELQLGSARLTLDGPLLSPGINARAVFANRFWPGQSTLTLDAAATTAHLSIQRLTLALPKGRVEARGQLAWQRGLTWDGALAWQNVDLQQFAEAIDGELSGELSTEVQYVDGDLRAAVAIDAVTGTWLEKRLAASGRLAWRDNALAVQDLRLRQGDNRISAAGMFAPGERLDLTLRLDLPRAGELLPEDWAPDAGGALRGDVTLAGALDSLIVNGDVTANDLRYGGMALAGGELQLRRFNLGQAGLKGAGLGGAGSVGTGPKGAGLGGTDSAGAGLGAGSGGAGPGPANVRGAGGGQNPGSLALTLDRLAVTENLVGNVTLRGQGNLAQHALDLRITGLREQSDKAVQLGCSGGFAGRSATPLARWQGSCDQLILQLALLEQTQTWRLAAPVQIDARPRQASLTVSDFCLSNAAARLCSREVIRYADGDLSALVVTGDQLPVAWLEPLLPGEDISASGHWQFRLEAAQLLDQPRVNAAVAGRDIAFRWQPERRYPITVDVTNLDLGWRWLDQRHQLSWQLQTKQSGATRGAINVDTRPAGAQRIAGELEIDSLQLGHYARLFLPDPEDALSGQVNAKLSLAGTLDQPMLSGRLTLDDGLFASSQLPVPLRDIQLALAVDDNRATAGGSFRAADSDGRISGEFTWRGRDWSGQLALSSDPLVLQPEPGVRLHVAPDLRFTFTPRHITIAGQVRVPEAQIEVTELPEQAVRVSSDAVIVGEQDADTELSLTTSTSIELILGDRVSFEGFGLETRVVGSLRLQQSQGELLKANGKLQLVEGRYQAYGQNLVIRNGDLIFVGDIDNPQIRLEAVRADTPEDVVVGLRASGPANNPQISLFSRPDMPQQAQLSFLLTGNPPGTRMNADPQLAATEAALRYALESSLGTGITRRAGDVLGIEDLQVTAGGSDETGTQIGLSGYITPNLLVRYGVGVFEAINTLTLRYQLSKSLYLEAISGENSDVGLMWSFERN